MWTWISYVLVFILCWWAIAFVIGGVASLAAYKLRFDYDVFDAPTPIPIIIVAIIGFFVAYQFLRGGFDMLPPFLDRSAQNEVATAGVPAPSRSDSTPPSIHTSNSDPESRILFWVGLALSLPIGVVASLLASWIHSQVTKV